MRFRLLLVGLWRYHRTAVVLTVSTCVIAIAVILSSGNSVDPGAREAPPRLLLNRLWFDRFPESTRDEVSLSFWLAGGIGLFEHGSVWRSAHDVFEFERRGRDLSIRFLHDGAEARTAFHVEECTERPPFELCLTLVSPPRGPERWYAFGSTDEMAAHLPWAARVEDAARARASAALTR